MWPKSLKVYTLPKFYVTKTVKVVTKTVKVVTKTVKVCVTFRPPFWG